MTIKRMLVLALSALFGAFLGWAVSSASFGHAGPLTFVFGFAAAIFVHELGHVMGALMVRFRVTSFTVGPLMLRREPSGIRLRRSPVRIGGLVTIVPVGSHDLRKRMLIVVAAGPVSSFLFALLGFVIGYGFAGEDWVYWMPAFAVFSATLGIASLIPSRRFYLSDGARMWEMLRSPEKADRQCALLAILEAASAGTRPREWDASLVAKGLAVTGGSSGDDVAANLMAYERAMDRGEFDLAEKHLEAAANLRSKCPVNVKSGIAVDAAFFYSMVREDKALAREWLNECDRRQIHDQYCLLMVEAAVFLVEGNWREALRKVEQSAAAIPRAQLPGFAAAAKDWLKTISERAQTKLQSSSDIAKTESAESVSLRS